MYLILLSKPKETPIPDTKEYGIFGVLPIMMTPIVSFLIWLFLSRKIGRDTSYIQLAIESFLVMFITWILLRVIFKVRSKIRSIIGITDIPDGT